MKNREIASKNLRAKHPRLLLSPASLPPAFVQTNENVKSGAISGATRRILPESAIGCLLWLENSHNYNDVACGLSSSNPLLRP